MNTIPILPVAPAEFLEGPGRSLPPSHSVSARRLSVEEAYQLWAANYDHDPNPLLALEERTMAPLLPNLNGKDVVDVACGTGRWLAKSLSLGARSAVGADFSHAMLKVATEKRSMSGHLLRCDFNALPLRSEVADVVICSFAIGHIGDVSPLACELARVARRGADVFVTDLHPEGYASGWRTGFRHGNESIEIASFLHSAEDVRAAFASQHLEVAQFLDARLGDPERAIFARAGMPHLFEGACRVPAVLICHFRRRFFCHPAVPVP